MTSAIRIVGFLMIVLGALLAASWLIDPLRHLWPMLLALPLAMRIGLAISGIGLLVVLATVIHDRPRANREFLKEQLGGEE